MARKPAPDDLAALDDLLARALKIAGSKQAVHERLNALPGKRGRPKANDAVWLAGLEIVCRLGERQGIDRHDMLTRFAQADTSNVFGPGTPDSIARRFMKRLKEKNITELELNDLLQPHGPIAELSELSLRRYRKRSARR